MAAAITTANGGLVAGSKRPKSKRICFSFAAYTKTLVESLKSSNILVADGLTDAEFSYVESKFNFTFPPDLRSILQQGLPISPCFPDWRSLSAQQLEIRLNLPLLFILRKVSRNKFWHRSWGPEPNEPAKALNAAQRLLKDAPVLVPVYQHCYIPSTPNSAGNPVFYIDQSGDVRLLSFDIAGFFREAEFLSGAAELAEPAWAAKEARTIEFWSELAEASLCTRRGWWWSCGDGKLGHCLERVVWRLRDGGWREEDIREMMMMMDGCDDEGKQLDGPTKRGSLRDKEAVVWHVRVLALVLLRAGWSREDVVDSLGTVEDEGKSGLGFYQEPQSQSQSG